MSYDRLVSQFVADNVQQHSPNLRLTNPHYDRRLARWISDKRAKLDWLHNTQDFTIQFVGSHWWHLQGLYDDDAAKALGRSEQASPFSPRLTALGILQRFQMSNCAMGYIPALKRATGSFTRGQILYLRPKKLEEYRTMGTKTVFAMGSPSVKFHLYSTGMKAAPYAEAVDNGPIKLRDEGLVVIPLPHPGGQGILNYLRARGREALNAKAQNAAFRELVNKGLRSVGQAEL